MRSRQPVIEIVDENVDESLTKHDRMSVADIVDEYRSGTIDRRRFLKRAGVFGLSALSMSSVLAACVARPGEQRGGGGKPNKSVKLSVAVESDTDTVDPQAFKTIPGYYMLAHLYDQLIDVRASAQGDVLMGQQDRPAPMLATSMEVAPDRRSVTFKLNPQARFEDGKPITVEDVKYTFTRGIEGTQYTGLLAQMLTLSKPEHIVVRDPQTVAFELDKPNPMAERLLSLQVFSIQSKAVSEQRSTPKDKWADGYWRAHVYANGPYKLKEWNRGEGWELAPNERYYRTDLPKNGGVIARIIPNADERAGLVRSGKVHAATNVAPKDAAAIRDDGEQLAKLLTAPSPWVWGLAFNNSAKPLNDVRVRQALSYAVPYQAIIDQVMHGLARPAKSIIAPGMPTHDDSFWNYATDLQKAKQLLSAAGYAEGFESSIDVFLGRQEDEQAATFIQESFRQIGVRTTINKLADAQYQDHRNNAKFAMMIVEWFSWVNDPFYHLFWNLQSKNAFTNAARYSNTGVDGIIAQGLYETDAAKRESLSKRAQQIVVEEAPWAFLFARDWYLPVAKDLKDVAYWPDQNLRLQWSYL